MWEGKYFNDNLPKGTAYFSYRDAPETQRHVNDQRFGRRVTSGRTVEYASDIRLECMC